MALPKTVKDLLHNTVQDVELQRGRQILAMHEPELTLDVNGNGDDVFNASNIDQTARYPRHGYEPGEDEAAYDLTNTGNIEDNAEKARAAVLAKTIARWKGMSSREDS